MTNAEKYLKDGVSIEELIFDIINFENCWNRKDFDKEVKRIKKFFFTSLKPTLTEDERVILRNIDQTVYQKIGRDSKTSIFDLVLTGKDVRCVEIDDILKPDLFQFIKERRRI